MVELSWCESRVFDNITNVLRAVGVRTGIGDGGKLGKKRHYQTGKVFFGVYCATWCVELGGEALQFSYRFATVSPYFEDTVLDGCVSRLKLVKYSGKRVMKSQ